MKRIVPKYVMQEHEACIIAREDEARKQGALEEQKLQELFLIKINKFRKGLYIDCEEDGEFWELIKNEAIRLGLEELDEKRIKTKG